MKDGVVGILDPVFCHWRQSDFDVSFTTPLCMIEVYVNYNMLQGGSPRMKMWCTLFDFIIYLRKLQWDASRNIHYWGLYGTWALKGLIYFQWGPQVMNICLIVN